jgi:dienelactone hydrolase
VEVGTRHLPGDLVLVPGATGIVLFAHGSGSSRGSPRNRFVADVLQRRGLATLLFDLLDEDEAADRANVFDIDLLAGRVADAVAWVRRREDLRPLAIGLFGASTGAAAALRAAAAHPAEVAAVVSRGGRPDLAADVLSRVAAPTLLIVGGADALLIEPHREALQQLRCDKRLVFVPGATHLFEEPGALDEVARLAGDWFAAHLGIRPAARTSRTGRAGGPPGRSGP